MVVFYFSLLLFPHPSRFNLLHSITTSHSLFEPITTLGSLVVLLALFGLAILLARKHRLVSFSILWLYIHLVVESSVIGLEMIFEHRLYLPMVGFALLSADLLSRLLAKRPTWAVIAATLIVFCLGASTTLRNGVWQDHVTLLTDVVAKSPGSHRAWNNLGSALATRGDSEEALRHYQKALQVKPNYAETHYNLGVWHKAQGDPDQAMVHYLKALSLHPGHAGAHNNLGMLLQDQGKISEAVTHYRRALSLKPELAEAHNNMGILLENQGKLDEAIGHYREAARYEPDFAEAYNNLGIALTRKGRIKEGIESFSKALELQPDGERTYNNLGVALSQLGDYKTAIAYFTRALEIDPDYTEARRNLQIALQQESLSP